MRLNICSAIILSLVFGFIATTIGYSQPRRNIKVVLQIQQTGTSSQENVQGSGSVIIRRGTVYPSGRLTAGDRQTTVQRSSGIFTLVVDGGESILTVATRVPQSEVAYFHNYALGIGYIERRIVFNDVGTSLRVNAASLPDGQIKLRLTPRISYFSAGTARRHRLHRSSDGVDRPQRPVRIARWFDDQPTRAHPPDSRLSRPGKQQ